MGKFPNDVTEALYLWSLNGFCDDSGDVESPTGWYCRMDIDSATAERIWDDDDIDVDVDPADLRGYWMLYEDNSGFVYAERFDTANARDSHWDEMEAEYSKWDNDD